MARREAAVRACVLSPGLLLRARGAHRLWRVHFPVNTPQYKDEVLVARRGRGAASYRAPSSERLHRHPEDLAGAALGSDGFCPAWVRPGRGPQPQELYGDRAGVHLGAVE